LATLLPNGRQTFLDINGDPLAGGTVTFYVPGTTTLKDTYQDSSAVTLNTNPVILDASGQATIFGVGAYRQVVKDALGNVIWDQNTSDTAATTSSWGGTSTGTANLQVVNAPNFSSQDGQSIEFIAGFTNSSAFALSPNGAGAVPVKKDTQNGVFVCAGGEVVQGTVVRATYDATAGIFHITPTISGAVTGEFRSFGMSIAPIGWLQANGVAVSRATYAALFAAIGVTFGSGDGSTTFNLPNRTGRAEVGVDASAFVLTGATAVGSMLGEATHQLIVSEMPSHNHTGVTGNDTPDHTHSFNGVTGSHATAVTGATQAYDSTSVQSTGGASTRHAHSIPSQGGDGAHNNVQPSMAAFVCIKT
jgi:microcystin-dependent protein